MPTATSRVTPLATPEPPLPISVGETVLEVLDPAVVMPATSAEEALALARASAPYDVDPTPRIQLVRLANRDPSSDFGPEWTGWIIFSTDVPWRGTGGPYLGPSAAPQPTPYATYTWIYVSVDGEVIRRTQNGYESADQVPPLP